MKLSEKNLKKNKSAKENLHSREVKFNSLNSDLNSTHIIHGKTLTHYAEWAGHLSLKTFTNGRAFYNAGAGFYSVGDGQYLVLNEMQPYEITIDSETEIESFCLFFESDFAEKVNRSFESDSAQLLDDPEKPLTEKINFVQKLYSSPQIEKILGEIKNPIAQNNVDQLWLKEKLHNLMEMLLNKRQNSFEEMKKLSAMRFSTREELYKRIYRARDFMAATFDQPLTLEKIARTACLSTNHFLRTFKQIFRQTPHQYLTSLRLKKAQTMLTETDLSIITICHSIGFESHSSFSILFKRHFGLSPEKYRQNKGDIQ